MVVVTHELGFAREVAHRVVVMEAGRLIAPSQPRTREFLRKVLHTRLEETSSPTRS